MTASRSSHKLPAVTDDSSQPTPGSPADWYPIPDDPTARWLRYWDGSQWTEKTRYWDDSQWIEDMGTGEQSIELSRKEFARLHRNKNIEATIIAAVQWTALGFGNHTYERHIKAGLSMCGKTLAALMTEADEPILFIPSWLARDAPGPLQLGVILTFKDRAIAAWTEGTMRLTYFAHSIPYSSVRSVEHRSPTENYQTSLWVEANTTWNFNVLPIFKDAKLRESMINSFNGLGLKEDSTPAPSQEA